MPSSQLFLMVSFATLVSSGSMSDVHVQLLIVHEEIKAKWTQTPSAPSLLSLFPTLNQATRVKTNLSEAIFKFQGLRPCKYPENDETCINMW